ncbi:4-(cytidine 5'-diphospho)-2-C-methyl-D-erythritol kinase [Deferribacter autotrophicus]|uniref:4-(cytidine 5'-diphospho)-2-C-methyl-D-erythritol kinase n=1 Tax=Deferribacter autotrophicus TaxID=500465 RepID=UPI00165DED3A|nr:4-(cytidine 5'-diphospho)-2-C-methyl-D-erythritol kinase [Deferribacter autotrophicus]
MTANTIKCYAKINLFLYVTGKRKDGYHNLFTLFSRINLFDVLYVEPAEKFKIVCNNPSIPVDKKNLIYKVYDKLCETTGFDGCVRVYLYKNIPIEAGLGGGSSDAAGFLKLVNKIFNLRLSLDEMKNILRDVSADAPFFLQEKALIAKGIGDEFVADLDLCPLYLLLVKPSFGISTKAVYNSRNLTLTSEPRITNIHSLLNFETLISYMHNDLESVVLQEFSELRLIKKQMLNFGAVRSLMSGSGSTIFGIFPSKYKLEKAYCYFKDLNKDYFVYKTTTL